MRLEFELTADEYIEAVLAPPQGAGPPTSLRGVLGVIGSTIAGLAIASTFLKPQPIWPDVTLASMVAWAGRWEWLLPWILLYATAWGVHIASQRRQAVVFLIIGTSLAATFVGVILTIMASDSGYPPPLLNDFGGARLLPWLLWLSTLLQYCSLFSTRRRLRRAFLKSPFASTTTSINLDDFGITSRSNYGFNSTRWEFLQDVQATERCILLRGRDSGLYFIVPMRAVGDADQVEAFVAMLRSRIGRVGGFEVTSQERVVGEAQLADKTLPPT